MGAPLTPATTPARDARPLPRATTPISTGDLAPHGPVRHQHGGLLAWTPDPTAARPGLLALLRGAGRVLRASRRHRGGGRSLLSSRNAVPCHQHRLRGRPPNLQEPQTCGSPEPAGPRSCASHPSVRGGGTAGVQASPGPIGRRIGHRSRHVVRKGHEPEWGHPAGGLREEVSSGNKGSRQAPPPTRAPDAEPRAVRTPGVALGV